ncbi:hypothetical protein F511_21640 [Dorcoceras hygrometricum]|uniref:Glycosyl transferase family 1 domain-containing protein n=1 Tax=Dorcoceras hygrometricum TaxID=472368 RepID=A0A2Z7DDC5_9LAMI|nr:hypothetical protein F511_21640 [Dorcoceras hygrometricum]
MDSGDAHRQPANALFLLKPISILMILLAILFSQSIPHNLRPKKFVDVKPEDPPRCVLWMAPFLSGGGYSSEAWSYVLALHTYFNKQETPFFKLGIRQHGDGENLVFWEGLPLDIRNLAMELHQTECQMDQSIVVCHSEPGAWHPPLFQTFPCPPPAGYGRPRATIGRTMFETDRVNEEHVRRCNGMDFVWVPTEFHVNAFIESGVDPVKVRKIVQPVDYEFFNPSSVEPLDLGSVATQVLGSDKSNSRRAFVFLSVFKWEYRKGWDVLLASYLKEFSGRDCVSLYLLTNPYHTEGDFAYKIIEFVDSDLVQPVDGWAPVYVIDGHIPHLDIPKLYKAADAFVLPSRGEGWGRPIVEAMTMSLPVITTNWSGPTEYLTDENSYPLALAGMNEVREGAFKGHLRGEPCGERLQVLMRHVVGNPTEAKIRGRQARVDMMRRFSPEIVAHTVVQHLHHIFENPR